MAADGASGGLSRRDLIWRFSRVAGVSGAYVAMEALGLVGHAGPYAGAPKLPPRAGAGKRVIILGAGMAGLVSAWELKKAGFAVTVLEARNRPGGRIWTVRGGDRLDHDHLPAQRCTFDRGQYFNVGAARIPAVHYGVHDYCREFDVALETHVNVSGGTRFVSSQVRNGAPIERRRVENDVRGGVSELLSKAVNRGALDQELSAEDKTKLLDYLQTYGALNDKGNYLGSDRSGYATEPTVLDVDYGPRKPIPLKELIQDPRSAGNLSFGETLFQQSTMMQPVGGMDEIAYAFAARLRNEIDYGVEVTHIGRKDEGVRIRYTGADVQAGVIEGEYCICTIPFSVLSKISADFSQPVTEGIKAMNYSAAGKVAWEAPRFWERENHIYGGISYVDTDSNLCWYPSDRFNAPKGTLVGTYNFVGQAERFSKMSWDKQYETSRKSVEMIHPGKGVKLAKPVGVNWAHVPYSMGAWADEGPNASHDHEQMKAILGGDGPFFFAGQHLSPMGAWMEAAIRSSHATIKTLHERVKAT